MPRSASVDTRRAAPMPSVFHLRREEDFGTACSMRCLLVPYDGAVEVIINTAHGWEAYDHAAYHAAEPGLRPMVCARDRPCGYEPTPPA